MPKFIRAWVVEECPAALYYREDRYTNLWFDPEGVKPTDKVKVYLGQGCPPFLRVGKMEQFPSCCGIGVIHNLALDDALKEAEFTPELLAESIRTNMKDMYDRYTRREYFMAVTLPKNYDMWCSTFELLGGKVVRSFKNQNSGNTNNQWEIPAL